MTEPSTPPERPLSDQARTRIRAELLEAAQDPGSSTPRWLIPGLSAASVVLVAGLAYAAIGLGDDGAAPGGPAGGSASFVPETGQPSPIARDDPIAPLTTPGVSVPASPTPQGTQAGTGSCEEETANVLKGARLAVQVDEASSFWVKGEKFVLCDQLGGRTTVHHPLPMSARIHDIWTYDVSSIYDGHQIVRVAGGVVPEGSLAFDVAYTFPDGHTERARTSTDTEGRAWWYMAYTYPDPGGNELKQPEIEVTLSLSGVEEHYSLEYGLNTCAQANHGC
jgi:hypothetical protein